MSLSYMGLCLVDFPDCRLYATCKFVCMKYSILVVSYCRNMDSEKGEMVDFRDDDVYVLDLVNNLPLSKVIINEPLELGM